MTRVPSMLRSLPGVARSAAVVLLAGAGAASLSTIAGSRSAEAAEDDVLGVDPSFGNGGFASSGVFNDFMVAPYAAVDPQGRLLVLGGTQIQTSPIVEHNVLLRYLPDGTLDPEFGDEGKLEIEIEPSVFSPEFGGQMRTGPFTAVAVEPSGRILLVRGADRDIRFPKDREVVVRCLTAQGQLDTTYGVNGRAAIAAPDQLATRGKCPILVDSSGRLLVAFSYLDQGPPVHATTRIVRFTTAGVVDDTFGDGGYATLPATYANWPVSMAFDVSRRIVVGGAIDYFHDVPKGNEVIEPRVMVARFRANGTVDPTFDARAVDDPRFGAASGEASAVSFDPDGVVIVSTDDGLRRYQEDGEWERIFAFQSRGGLSATVGSKGVLSWDRDEAAFEQFGTRFFQRPAEPIATDSSRSVEFHQMLTLSGDSALAVGQVGFSGVVLVKIVAGGLVGGPDLSATFENVAVSPRALTGRLVVTCQGENARPTTAKWYLSDDAVLDASDDFVRTTRVGRVRAFDSRTGRFRLPVRSDVRVNGRFLLVELDANRALREAWRVNNVAATGPLQ